MVGERIKIIRSKLNLSQKEFAEKLNIKQNMLSYYESGRSQPPIDVVEKISITFNINTNWLLTGRGDIFIGDNKSRPEEKGIIYLPVLNTKVSAGYGIENFEITITDYFGLEERLVFPYKKEKLKVQTVRGDSMSPTLMDGDIVVVAEGVIDGDGIYVINRAGSLFVKRLQFKLTENCVVIISDNVKYDREILKDIGQQELIVIVGMVILHMHNFR
jgi:phage repressor protein C with HTH and peptisase S24 domain